MQLRQRLAYEAARLMADLSLGSYDLARRKAAARLGVANKRLWPNNAEVEEALQQQLRLFRPQQDEHLRTLRERAMDAMRALQAFKPRLVGPVLTGTAGLDSPVQLFLFAEVPEDVALALIEQGIPWSQQERDLRYRGGVRQRRPVFEFVAGGIRIQLLIFPVAGPRDLPLDPVTDRPQRGIGMRALQSLLEDEDVPGAQRWEMGT
jgi:hypothetical protein